MPAERRAIGVEMERRPARSRWTDHVWRAVGLGPPVPGLADWTPLGGDGTATRYYAGSAEIVLHGGDARNYRDNLGARVPSVYVVLRRRPSVTGLGLWMVTVDPAEAHAHVDVGDDLVEALPMPTEIRQWVAGFVARHPVAPERWKRRRDRADEGAPPIGRGGHGR